MRKVIVVAIIVGVIVALSAAAMVSMFFIEHPTHYKYNDSFVIGNTPENIAMRYGEFDKLLKNEDGNIFYAGYMIRDDFYARLCHFFFGLDDFPIYQIYFRDGVADKVQLSYAWLGG